MIWLLGGYMWLFIHRPFEVWPWLGDLHIERIYMIVMIVYWALVPEKRWIPNRLNAVFGFFCTVTLASWLLSPYSSQGSQTVADFFKVVVFYVLVMSTIRGERDLKFLVIAFLAAMSLYMAHSLREYTCGRGRSMMGTWRMIAVDSTVYDPNSFAAVIVFSLPMVYPLWSMFHASRLRWAIVGYIALATTCVLLTGSRMGFIGLCSLALIGVLLSKRRVAFIALLAVAAPLAWNLLPEDRQNRFLTIVNPSYGPANAQESAEARTLGFHLGVALWRQNPLLGVGPAAFATAIGQGHQAHNLYGQVLGETGTLGAVALAGMVFGFAWNMLDARRIFKSDPRGAGVFAYRVSAAVATTVILALVMGWAGHFLFKSVWLWNGAFQTIALACLRRREEEEPLAETEPDGVTLDELG
jgi:O-antigen ligase